jgi:hypothetical protein
VLVREVYMATVVVAGLAGAAVSFMIVFLVKICGESSRMKICRVLRVETERNCASEAANFERSDPTSQPLVLVERKFGEKLITMPRRVA